MVSRVSVKSNPDSSKNGLNVRHTYVSVILSVTGRVVSDTGRRSGDVKLLGVINAHLYRFAHNADCGSRRDRDLWHLGATTITN